MSLNQPKFCPSATWNPSGITFVDNNTIGQDPISIFVTANNSVYVVESALNRVQMWMEGSMISTRNISGGLAQPYGLFVTSNGDVYIDNGFLNGRVDKWAVNDTSSIPVMNVNDSCYSLFVDINDTLYCSLFNLHQVVKTSLNSGGLVPTFAVGNGTPGSASNMLNNPCGIFVDIKLNLYVADYANHRIQFFQAGQSNGSTLLQNGTSGTISFSNPTEIILDADGYLFVVDRNNQRIIGSSPTGFRCLIGCTGMVGLSYALNLPSSLGFDSYGNIFVIDRGNARVQKFLLATNSCGPSYNRPQLCPDASWNPYAITFANSSTISTYPSSIFVNINNTVYAASRSLGRIQIWLEGSISPTKNISGGLSTPYSVFATINGGVYVDNGNSNGRVDEWTSNSTNSTPAMYANGTCYGLFVDIYDNIYCSLGDFHKIIKKSSNDSTNTSTIVAGTGVLGTSSSTLNNPRGIFVDINFNLYVADCSNHRIQFFISGKLNATTLSTGNITLSKPYGVVLDADGYLFITDYDNNRVVGSGPNGFRCIAGCTGVNGSASNQLSNPRTLSFDSYGNIFVVDGSNNRIQKFFLATNSCNETLTSTQMLTSTTVSTEMLISTMISTEMLASKMNTEESSTNNIQSTSIMATSSTSMAHQINGISTLQTIQTSTINIAKTSTTDELSTTVLTITPVSSIPTMSSQTTQQLSHPFVPSVCSNSTTIGANCNISNSLCDMLKPCQNNGNCSNTNTTPNGYICSCSSSFVGTACQIDHRSCKPNTCWNNGICNETLNRTFVCLCTPGWQGINCETQINYCYNITCFNKGVCRPLFLNYTCECLGNSYSGRHCEITASKTVVLQTVSKSFAYIAIIATLCLAMFIITMDVLKYGFNIDPVYKRSKRIQQKKQVKKAKAPIIVRFLYVNPPTILPPENPVSTIHEVITI